MTGREAKAIRATEENFWSMWSQFGSGTNCALGRSEDALWIDTPIPSIPYNGVIRFEAVRDIDTKIDAHFAHYAGRGVPFFWMLHPSTAPADLDRRLQARGFNEVENVLGMWTELAALPPPAPLPHGVRIAPVESEAEVGSFLDFVAWRWGVKSPFRTTLTDLARGFEVGVPGGATRAWVAWVNGEPAAKAVTHRVGAVAGLYGVSTKPEFRGQGLARAVSLAALREARAAGCSEGVLHSSPMAVKLYESLGYRGVAPFHVFALPNSFHV